MMRRLRTLVLLGAAIAALGAFGAAPAMGDVVWLCMPGMEQNPCRDSLETTVQSPDGSSRVENPPLPADPPVDCFYVYPTVSEQRSRNADKSKDPEVIAVAQHQASRFSQACRVYAPVYRQQTLGGLALGGSAEALQLAYGDILEAWREYLAKHNRGRGFVLVGHSQGTRMLRQLLRTEIDPRAELRRQLVSATLVGGNVTVRKGRLAGGDFQNVPACTAAAQVGCLMAWSTFNEDPPSNSRYGRDPGEDTSGFGFPSGPDYEVLCTNPASLTANERRPLTTYVRGEPFPGVLGALVAAMYGGTQPSAPTAFLQPGDRYTGRCERRNDANVLMLEPIGNARRLNPTPDESWGLHLIDGNIALGDTVATTMGQARAYVAARTRPRLKLRLAYRAGRQGRRRCARPPVVVELRGADLGGVWDFELTFRGGAIVSLGGPPWRTEALRQALRPGRVARISALASLEDGRERRLVKHVRVCSR